MNELFVIMIAIFIIIITFPIYTTIRKSQGVEGSFDPIEEEPDNFEQNSLDFEADSVQYWMNNSKGVWGEYLEEAEKNNEKIL